MLFYQDEREEALADLKTSEQKYKELKVGQLCAWQSRYTLYVWNTMNIHYAVHLLLSQEEMAQYADNDPAAFEAMS